MDQAERKKLVRAAVENRYWNRATAQAVIAELEASGESTAEFARRRGLRVERLRRWGKALAEKQAGAVRFHPVLLADPNPGSHTETHLEVILSEGRKVAVRTGFDPATLLEVIRALESGSC